MTKVTIEEAAEAASMPLYRRAWECGCGHINGRAFTAQGWDSDHGPYDICSECGFETYSVNQDTHRLKVVQEYLLVPVSRPWEKPPSA